MIKKREAVLFLVVVFWMKRGEVLGQCEGDVSPIQYDSDGTCNIHDTDGVYVACKNYRYCRPDPDIENQFTCQYSNTTIDYPFGESCRKDEDCLAPLYSRNQDHNQVLPLVCNSSFFCDYRSLPNGYSCQSNNQCASSFCDKETCNPKTTGDSVICLSDSDCPAKNFCDVDGACVPHLKDNTNCTLYADSIYTANYVCKSGSACLPHNDHEYRCNPIFEVKLGKYCGGSEYACRYGYYCDDETSKCEPLSTYSGHKPACDSLNVTSCPLGYKCGCAGEMVDDMTETNCEKYINPICETTFSKYHTCLSDHGCPFDPLTLVNNPSSATPDFVGPLNRFSCANRNCQSQYLRYVKCQNQDFKGSNNFTPALTPKWAHANDSEWQGWEVALLTVGLLGGMILLASIALLIKEKPVDEDFETVH